MPTYTITRALVSLVFAGVAVSTPSNNGAAQTGGANWFQEPSDRAFSSTSYWNTRLPKKAPKNRNNAAWIADSMDPAHTQPYLRLPDADGPGVPIYDAVAGDPLHDLCSSDGRHCFNIHIPAEAAPADTSDAIFHVWDSATDQVIGLHKASRNSDGSFSYEGIDHWYLSSRGLHGKFPGGTPGNFGHRGLPAPIRVVRLREVQAGAIRHRLSCFWHATAPRAFWPMTAFEAGKGGVVPEGVVIRIKPSVDLSAKPLTAGALVIARALQRYGCMIGDNSGSDNTLALEKGDWSKLLGGPDALSSIPFTQWKFLKGGYNPAGE